MLKFTINNGCFDEVVYYSLFISSLKRCVRRGFKMIVTYSESKGYYLYNDETHGVIYTDKFVEELENKIDSVYNKVFEKC